MCVETKEELKGYYFIFQHKKNKEAQELMFLDKKWHERKQAPVTVANYKVVYGGPLFNDEVSKELEEIFAKFNIDRPEDFKGHSLSISDVVVTVTNSVHAYFVDSFGFSEEPAFLNAWSESDIELAFRVADRFIAIQNCSEGYEWNICDENGQELDGGVYDDFETSILEVLNGFLLDDIKADYHNLEKDGASNMCRLLKGSAVAESMLVPVDYDELIEKMEEFETEKIAKARTVGEYRQKTQALFQPMDGLSADEIEQRVLKHICDTVRLAYPDKVVSDIGTAVLVGSRSRGLERKDSDIDIVVEYTGAIKEYQLFNLLNEEPFLIGNIRVDINPIHKEETGTLADYLLKADAYLEQKKNTFFRVYWKKKDAPESEEMYAYVRAYDETDAMKVAEWCLNLERYEVTNISSAKKHQITRQSLVLNCMDVIYELEANY